MNYAVMPIADYDSTCDKVRKKVDLTEVRFEDTDFGYVRSAVFVPTERGEYIFTIEVKDGIKLNIYDFYFTEPEWDGSTYPGMFEPIDDKSMSAYMFKDAYRIFINNSFGIQASDILSATLSYNGEVVENFVEPKKIKSGELADMVDVVYEAGAESGKQTEKDEFWELYQQNGNLTVCDCAFAGRGWTDKTFNPKYKMIPTSAYMMFRYTEITKDISDDVDFSKSTNNGYVFYGAKIKRLNFVDLSSAQSLVSVFGQSTVTEKISLKISNNGAKFTDMFTNMKGLVDLAIDGKILEGNTNLASSTLLSVESAKSFITALADNSGTANEFKFKVTFSETTKSLLEAEGATAPNGDTWLNYMTAKGWNR